MYTVLARAPFPYSYTFTRSSDSLDLHIPICDYLLLIRYLEWITGIPRSIKFSLFDTDIVTLFYSYRFL